MRKFKVVLHDGTKVEIEADKFGYTMDGRILELKDKDYHVIAAFSGFQYWQELPADPVKASAPGEST